ncbi:MAG: Rpn family recombination-promoting nuclease/putative transposase [Prevotellaceae bacterium]|jgi:predicted transposase/invertase (TIGR01784 family)|nr:Rpn family recombination-promoting nuclease/putative transposase [Prevotellaceae bacterium]
MTGKRLNPLNDYLFMKYMGEKGDEEQLTAFLNVVLQKTGKNNIKSVTILENRKISADIIGGKSSELDVRAEMGDGSIVNIEVQLRNVYNMDKRSLFYWSREYSKHIDAGKDYTKLSSVITINILGAEFLSLDEIHASFHLWEDTHKDCLLTDVLEMHFIDMIKFRRLKDRDIENNALHRWLTFFDKKTGNETIKKIIKMDAAIKKANDKIMYVAQDKESLHIYQMHEKAVLDYNSGINAAGRKGLQEGENRGLQNGLKEGEKRGLQKGLKEGEKRGLQKGLQEGEKRGLQEGEKRAKALVVINLQQLGFSLEEISKYTTDVEKLSLSSAVL